MMSSEENLLFFSVTFKCCLHSVNIYHLMITRKNNYQCYSFYLRYNTQLSNHDYAKTNYPKYRKILNFPKRKKIFWHKKVVRDKEFQIYFDSLLSESDLNSNLGNILELFGLNSHFSLSFTSILNASPLLLMNNPVKSLSSKDSKGSSEHYMEDSKQEVINLRLNGKTFHFVEKLKLGSGEIGEAYLYSLNDENEESYQFAGKKIDFIKNLSGEKKCLLNN